MAIITGNVLEAVLPPIWAAILLPLYGGVNRWVYPISMIFFCVLLLKSFKRGSWKLYSVFFVYACVELLVHGPDDHVVVSLFIMMCMIAVAEAAFVSALDRKTRYVFLSLFIIVGMVEALYGMLSIVDVWNLNKVLSFPRGHFINRNHFAAFLYAPMFFSLYLYEQFKSKEDKKSYLFLSAAAICFAGILTSLSRGGMLASAVGFIVYILLRWREKRRGILLPMAGGILFLTASIGIGPVLRRFLSAVSGGGMVFRLETASACLKMFLKHPLFGVGLGKFECFYPSYATMDTTVWVAKYAHNDFLQFVAEAGVFGIIFIAAVLYFACRHLKFKKIVSTSAVAACAALAAFAAQSLVDFELHILSILIVAFSCLGFLAGRISVVDGDISEGIGNFLLWRKISKILLYSVLVLFGLWVSVTEIFLEKQANQVYQTSLISKLRPFSSDYLLSEWKCCMKKRDFVCAVNRAKAAASVSKGCPRPLYAAAAALFESGDACSAYRWSLRAARADIMNSRVWKIALRSALRCSEVDRREVRDIISSLADIGVRYIKDAVFIMLSEGVDASKIGDFLPHRKEVLREAGIDLFNMGHASEAVDLLRDVVDLEGDRETALIFARILAVAGDYSSSLILLEQLLRTSEDESERTEIYRAMIKPLKISREEALLLTALKGACVGRGGDYESCAEYIRLLYSKGAGREALKLARELQNLRPADCRYGVLEAECLELSGETGRAMRKLRGILSERRDCVEASEKLGEILEKHGFYMSAAEQWRKVLKYRSHNIRIKFLLARALALAGKIREAEILLKEVLKERPSFGDARVLLRQLNEK